jgi:hypothetical protein
LPKSKCQNPNDNSNPNASMPKQPLPLNLPLRVRGIKGGYFQNFITPLPAKELVRRAGLPPLILRGGFTEKFSEIQMPRELHSKSCQNAKSKNESVK